MIVLSCRFTIIGVWYDKVTGSMHKAIEETERRRSLQQAYNIKHNITPKSVSREVTKSITPLQKAIMDASKSKKKQPKATDPKELLEKILALETAMKAAAINMEFEKAIAMREEWQELKVAYEKLYA